VAGEFIVYDCVGVWLGLYVALYRFLDLGCKKKKITHTIDCIKLLKFSHKALAF
jgi:hypothetical protein